MEKAPDHILEIVAKNPDPPQDFGTTGSSLIAYGTLHPSNPLNLGGPFPSVAVRQEWKQVLASQEDYEISLVGASGWILDKKISGADVPFSHPFGFDFEFMMALDDAYQSLLARGNQVPEEDDEIVNEAKALQLPVVEGPEKVASFLGVEIDEGLVPKLFQDGVNNGDRVAVFGRWIVDCGHEVTVQVPNAPPPAFRSEIHPPLLIASARVTKGSIAGHTSYGPDLTRALFTSRPYLVSQRFTTDTSKIYDDAAPDDGPFVDHMVREFAKVNDTVPLLGIPTASTMVEAHTKIKSHPFYGAHLAHFVLRPPTRSQTVNTSGHHHLGEPGGPGGPSAIGPRLVVSFQFTVRSGCAVQVVYNAPDSVDVIVALSHGGYTSPPLPNRTEFTYSKDYLGSLNAGAASAITKAEWLSGVVQAVRGGPLGIGVVEAILSRGIKGDKYDTAPLLAHNLLDASHAYSGSASEIGSGNAGIVTDDTQPFPFFGWIELGWVEPTAHP